MPSAAHHDLALSHPPCPPPPAPNRNWHIGQAKSKIASDAATKINASFKVNALQNRVSPDTEAVFNDAFWQGLDLVVNALDNVNARLYVDSRWGEESGLHARLAARLPACCPGGHRKVPARLVSICMPAPSLPTARAAAVHC